MHENNIFLFCATIVTIIISSEQTKQQWPFPYYRNNFRNTKSIGPINHLYKPPLTEPPVVSSKKIDIAINERIKPIYWSTLLPEPVKTYSNYESLKNDLNGAALEVINREIPNSADYYAKLLVEYMSRIYAADNINNNADNVIAKEIKKAQPVKRRSKRNRKKTPRQKNCAHKSEIQERNDINTKNPDDKLKRKSGQFNNESTTKSRNENFKLPVQNCNQRLVKEKNKNIFPNTVNQNCQLSLNTQRQKKTNCCKNKKSNRREKDRAIENKIIDIDESNIEIKEKEKIINFDQRCVDVEDILNINLEYSDCDCECIRNSRNNGNIKESRKKQYDKPNKFPEDYLNMINNLMSNDQYRSFYQGSNYMFPFNFDYFYQAPISPSKKSSKKASKEKQKEKRIKSSGKQRKKSSNKKYSNKKRKISKNNNDDCDTVIELAPSIMKIELSEDVSNVDTIAAKYISNIDSVEYSTEYAPPYEIITSAPVKPHVTDIPKIVKTTKDEHFEENHKIKYEVVEIENSQEEAEYEDQSSISEELIIPLLPEDMYYFWEDYYPDFTFDNSAYITSSEEEDWINFHKYYHLNEFGANKEILKRNLSGRPKPKFDWTINSQNHQRSRKPNTRAKFNKEIDLDTSLGLEHPNFVTRIVNKEDVPSYIDILLENNNKNANYQNNFSTHSTINGIETVYAPSKVKNYSFKPIYDNIYDSSEEERIQDNLLVRENGLTIVYSSPFINN